MTGKASFSLPVPDTIEIRAAMELDDFAGVITAEMEASLVESTSHLFPFSWS